MTVYQNIINDSVTRGYPLIIAELGAKYGGIESLIKSVDAAHECGVDYVKFQTFKAETIAVPGAKFVLPDKSEVSQYDYFKKYELTEEDHSILKSYCEDNHVKWLSTPSHTEDIHLLEKFTPALYKTGSDDLTNIHLLEKLAETGKPMIISTGMSTLPEVEKAVETVVKAGNNQIILMHCVVSYPSLKENANLKIIETLKNAFGFPVGLSDHSVDAFTSILATTLGIVMLEKHFTIDHKLKYPDDEASLDPKEFSDLIRNVKSVPLAMGDGVKKIQETEIQWRNAARKSICAARNINAGEKIKAEDLFILRSPGGMHPHQMDSIIGKIAKKNIKKNDQIRFDLFKEKNI